MHLSRAVGQLVHARALAGGCAPVVGEDIADRYANVLACFFPLPTRVCHHVSRVHCASVPWLSPSGGERGELAQSIPQAGTRAPPSWPHLGGRIALASWQFFLVCRTPQCNHVLRLLPRLLAHPASSRPVSSQVLDGPVRLASAVAVRIQRLGPTAFPQESKGNLLIAPSCPTRRGFGGFSFERRDRLATATCCPTPVFRRGPRGRSCVSPCLTKARRGEKNNVLHSPRF